MPIIASPTRQAWIRVPEPKGGSGGTRRKADPAAVWAAQLSYFAGRPVPRVRSMAALQSQPQMQIERRKPGRSAAVENWEGPPMPLAKLRKQRRDDERDQEGLRGGERRERTERRVVSDHPAPRNRGKGRREDERRYESYDSDDDDDGDGVVVIEEASVRSASPPRPREHVRREREREYERERRPVPVTRNEYRPAQRVVSASRWDEERDWRARQAPRSMGYAGGGGGRGGAGGGGRMTSAWASATEPLML